MKRRVVFNPELETITFEDALETVKIGNGFIGLEGGTKRKYIIEHETKSDLYGIASFVSEAAYFEDDWIAEEDLEKELKGRKYNVVMFDGAIELLRWLIDGLE